MYGYESTGGLGGVAARAVPNPYLARSLMIRDPGAMIVGDPTVEGGSQLLPFSVSNGPNGGPVSVSWSGSEVTQDPGKQLGSWREILDWHNSPAPWVLLMILFVYGYVHVSYRKGRLRGGAGL